MVTLNLRRQEVEAMIELLEQQEDLGWPLAGLSEEFRETIGWVSRKEQEARESDPEANKTKTVQLGVFICESDYGSVVVPTSGTVRVKLIGGPEMFDGTDYDAHVLEDGEMVPVIERLFIDEDTGNTRVAIYRHDGENYRFSHVSGWAERYHKPFSPTSGDQL